MDNSTRGLVQHPLRSQVYAEIHARPYPLIEHSVKATHFALLTNTAQAKEQLTSLKLLTNDQSISDADTLANCYYTKFQDFEIRWEKHQEFCSITFIEKTLNAEPFSQEIISPDISSIITELSGELVVALKVHFERKTEQPSIETLNSYFENQQIYGSTIVGDKASMWSSFKLHKDDYARMLIYDSNLSNYQAGRTLQRIIEVETYMRLALLALPSARAVIPEISKISLSISNIIRKLQSNANSINDEHNLLGELSINSVQIEDIRAATTHRFAASNAYYELVEQRLDDLREVHWPGYSSWKKMLQRRLIPAIDTCNSVSSQLQNLTAQTQRATELLQTRIELSIQDTNMALLSSIDKRSHLQLRLQQTVEGLSVVAISYYVVGLIKAIAVGFNNSILPNEPSTIAAIAVIPVLLTTSWLIRRVRNKINTQDIN